MKIADNVFMLQVGTYHLVLTWDAENLVLIDAGFPGQIDELTEAMKEAGFAVANLTHLIITHQDWDHVGCVTDLQRLVPKLRVIAHGEEAPYIDGRKIPLKLAARLAVYDTLAEDMRAMCDQWQEVYQNQQITITDQVHDGIELPLCGGIQVIHTPGHTPGHIVLHLRESGIMVCGDAANVQDGELVSFYPEYDQDIEQAKESLAKLKAYEMKGAVAYHSGFLKVENFL